MTEHLRPCPFCGGNDLTTERPASNPVGCDNCGLYVATPEDWNERALGPALDVVLEAVEALSDEQWRTLLGSMHQDFMDNPMLKQETIEEGCRSGTARMLRALRDAHSHPLWLKGR